MKLPPVCAGGRTQIRKNTVLAWKRNILPEKKGGFLLEDLYAVSMSREKVHVASEDREPWKILGLFLRGMLKFPGVMEVEKI